MKTIITGSKGLLGSAIHRIIKDDSICPSREDLDISKESDVKEYLKKNRDVSDTIIHCAAKVGGVKANMENNKSFFLENIKMDNNIMMSAFENEYENIVTVLSTCVFPDKVEYPLISDYIENGPPHFSNYGYAYAKRHLGYSTKMFRNASGKNWISVIPTNLYGINDNFSLENSHVIPALIRKAYESKINDEEFVIWGDGSPLRQFVYSDDMAQIILWAKDNWKSEKPIMAVNEKEYSIKEIALMIAEIFEIQGNKIRFDCDKPSGQFRKPAKSDVPDYKFIDIREGLEKTCKWFIKNYNYVRL